MSPSWSARTWKPTARTGELLVEELGEELLIYDQRNDQVHCLDSAAWRVWRACDGNTSVEQLGAALDVDSEVVDRALAELDACGLLDGEAAGGVTRREATARLAKLGAAAAAAPLIYSIAAPTPALASTLHFCQGTFNCVGASPVRADQSGLCNTCLMEGCACCWTTPHQCTLNNGVAAAMNLSYTRCIGSCMANVALNIPACSIAYIHGGGGLCAPVTTYCPTGASRCS